jgi:hypothetical protein
VVDHYEWAFFGVYGPHVDNERMLMWDELSGVQHWWDVSWCVGGDFNVIQFPSKHLGAAGYTSSMFDFSDFISINGLVDIPMERGSFTWSNNRDTISMSRLDRFLFTTEWEGHYSRIGQRRLCQLLSNHFPIVLNCGNIQQSQRPFRFENMWMKATDFMERVEGWWGSYQFDGTPSFILAKKLRALRTGLKKWNEEVFGNVLIKKNALFNELHVLESIAEYRALTNEEKGNMDRVRYELEQNMLLDEISLRQKSRVLWLKGDKNSKFFHHMENPHRRINTIGTLHVATVPISDQDIIQDHIVNFYKSLFTESGVRRPLLDGLHFNSLDEEEEAWLERPVDEEEIFNVVMGFNGDKAPGPNGFPLSFFQHCWHIVKHDILTVAHECHMHNQFEKSLNATFIALIPKKSMEVKDFRPISLVGQRL